MAAGRLLLPGWMPAVDSNGDPIPNAKVYFYFNKTSTLAPVYSDESLTVRIANPVEANATGRFPAVWADGEVLYSASVEAPYGPAGVPFTYDNLSASLAAEIVLTEAAEAAANDAEVAYQNILDAIQAAQDADGDAALAGAIAGATAGADAANVALASLSETTGAGMVGFKHSSSAYPTTVNSAIDKTGNVRLFGAIGDGVSRPLSSVTSFGVLNTSGWNLSQWQTVFPHATALTDQLDWCAIQASINWRQASGGGGVYLPSGNYRTNKTLNITGDGIFLFGDGSQTVIRPTGGNFDTVWFHHPSGDAGKLSGNGVAMLVIQDTDKTDGLTMKVEQVQRFFMNDVDLDNTGGTHWRAFNNVVLNRVRSWFPARAVNHFLLTGGEGGTGSPSDVFTLRDCSMSGSNSSSSSPSRSDIHGLVVDGFVTTVLCDKVYQIGVEGVANLVRNNVSASLPPRHIHFRGNEVEWPSLDAIRVEAGAWVRITECDLAGAWQNKGISLYGGTRHVLIANNDIRDNGAEGITTNGTHVQIIANRIYANSRPSRGGTSGSVDGIYLFGDSRVVVVENNILGDDGVSDYQRYGVSVGGGADQHIIRNNIGIYNDLGVLSSPYPTSSTRLYGDNMGTSDIG